MQELRRLIDQYGERYSTAIIYVIFAAVSLLVAAILFGILHSTGVMKLVLAGAVQEAEFGGAFAGFLITLILLIRYYNIVQKETKLVITGNVLLTDGNPVQGALIFVEGVDRQKLTDTTGWFTIEVDKQDSWTVRASYEGKNAKETIRRKDIRKPIRLELHQELEVLERASSPVPAAESESKPPPDTTGNLQAQLPSEEQLVAEVVSRDPLLANPAAGILQQRPDLISNIVDKYPSTPIAEAAVKSILRLYPQLSSKL